MAAGDAVQKGQQWKLHFGNLTHTGYLPTSWTHKDQDADDEVIKDERGATITHILSDPREVMSGDLLIKSTGSITPPAKGDYVWLKGPDDSAFAYYYVVDASVTFGSGVTRLSLSLILEDSQTGGAVWDSTSTQQATGQNFDLASPADITDDITLGDATEIVRVVDGDGTVLVEDTDYSFADGTFTLDKDEWLADTLTEEGQTATVWVYFDLGAPISIVITCVDNS